MNVYLPETVRRTIQEHHLLLRGMRVLVGVSGGADSLALLHILHGLSASLELELHVATFDHQLRGAESAADAEFVRATCEAWGIPVTVGSQTVKELAKEKGVGLETAARNARYAFLADVARKASAKTIAVAHHADDQAETLLLHLVRGSGVHGMKGMRWYAPAPGFPSLTLIRPLLGVTRAEIEAYCREHGLTPRQDSSNDDTTILRNFLRHETLPHLAQLNPQIQQVLARLAETMAVEDEFFEQELEALIYDVVLSSKQGVRLKKDDVSGLHPALQRRLLIWAVKQVGEVDDLDYKHIVDAVEIGVEGKHGAIAQFKNGMRLRVQYDELVIERDDAPVVTVDVPLMPEGASIPITIPSITKLEGWEWVVTVEPPADMSQVCSLCVPENVSVSLRTRKRGDRFTPLGMGGHSQKIKDWMVNRRVPQMVRNSLPLLIIGNEVAAIWFEGKWTISEQFKTESCKRVVYFELRQHS